MSQLTLCDLCGNSCQSSDFFHLSGWWKKHLTFDHPKLEKKCYEPKLGDEVELKADVCGQCVLDRLGFIQLHVEPARDRRFQERREKHPEESYLKSLRMVSAPSVDDVFCDICQAPCYEKHLRFQSQWKTSGGSTMEAEVCARCVESRLKSLIRFQSAVVLRS